MRASAACTSVPLSRKLAALISALGFNTIRYLSYLLMSDYGSFDGIGPSTAINLLFESLASFLPCAAAAADTRFDSPPIISFRPTQPSIKEMHEALAQQHGPEHTPQFRPILCAS